MRTLYHPSISFIISFQPLFLALVTSFIVKFICYTSTRKCRIVWKNWYGVFLIIQFLVTIFSLGHLYHHEVSPTCSKSRLHSSCMSVSQKNPFFVLIHIYHFCKVSLLQTLVSFYLPFSSILVLWIQQHQ